MDMQHVEQAIALLKANGYRVSKPRKTKADLCMEYIAAQDKLNAVGKPYSPQYDPNYKMKHKPRQYAPRGTQVIGNGISPAQWLRMCCEAQAEWNKRNPPCGPCYSDATAII